MRECASKYKKADNVVNSPTRVKVNIRDMWDKEDSEVQKSICGVKTLIGVDVNIEPEWQLLWTELQKNYPDPGLFVPNIASAVSAWCRCICELADDDKNEAWTETLLEKLKESRWLNVLFEVC